ncbi:hypothetical protein ACFYNO_06790 [Kitasatospora sp. NPDC006697]|uniref:hypothetical protein n=1 Tax=Kitasatospora sp. NPDC006697 TaxID=3364020 RepID=UPI00367B33DD
MVTVDEVLRLIGRLRVHHSENGPARHQPITLLWAIGRAASGEPRLTRWRSAHGELGDLLERYGRPGATPTPEFPFIALHRSGLWSLEGFTGEVPAARGSAATRWITAQNPRGGLTPEVHALMAGDPEAREAVVRHLLELFGPEQRTALLAEPGLRGAAPTAEFIPAERHATARSTVTPAAGEREAVRQEGGLSAAYEEFLVARGHVTGRYRITVPSTGDSLQTDLFDRTADVLYEAKGDPGREAVRMAIGQLLDYRRHIGRPDARLAILLPGMPDQDVRELIGSVGIALVVKDGDGFHGYPVGE